MTTLDHSHQELAKKHAAKIDKRLRSLGMNEKNAHRFHVSIQRHNDGKETYRVYPLGDIIGERTFQLPISIGGEESE